MSPSPLVTPRWLHDHLESVVVADVRWYLDGRSGADAYARGHLPSAHFVDLDADLARTPGPGRPGRHPLPDPARFAAFLQRLGVGPDTLVVGYDDAGGATAARLWWLLDYFGHRGGRVLDGGIQGWIAEGYAQKTSAEAAPRSALPPAELLRLAGDRARVTDKGGVQSALERGSALVIDARAPERFRGEIERIDARAGHIPGAVNAPFTDNLRSPGGPFRDPAELQARYRAAGVERDRAVLVYCGSGVTACHDLLALRLAGFDGTLYEGSWGDWAGDPSLPVATGA